MSLIALSQRTERLPERGETRDALDQRWAQFLCRCGLTPLIIPNDLGALAHILQRVSFQGVLLTGGNDSPERTDVEVCLLEYAFQKKMPLLGVCQGMQRIQKYFGVELQKVSGHIAESQHVWIEGTLERVNSYHEYGAFNTVPELDVWAIAPDGVIKAVRHPELPIVGVMWHPERNVPFKASDVQWIQKFFRGVDLT